MSPQKRRPQPRKGRTAVAAHKSKKGSDRTLTFVGIGVLVVGITLVFLLKPATSHAGLQLGDHWHAALGVYACDHWDGDADWATPVNPSTNGPVQAGTNTYNALHSHRDGLIHMEPAVTADTGDNATLGNYFKYTGYESELDPRQVRHGRPEERRQVRHGRGQAALARERQGAHWRSDQVRDAQRRLDRGCVPTGLEEDHEPRQAALVQEIGGSGGQ